MQYTAEAISKNLSVTSNLRRPIHNSCSTDLSKLRICKAHVVDSLKIVQENTFTLSMAQKQRPKRRLSNTPKFVEEKSYFKMLRETKEKAAKQVTSTPTSKTREGNRSFTH